MGAKKASGLLLTALDDVAWTLNLRGADIPYNPVFFAYLFLTRNHAHLFIDAAARTGLQPFIQESKDLVTIHPYNQVLQHVKGSLSDLLSVDGEKVWLPGASTSFALASLVPEDRSLTDPSPVAYLKACKNPTELAGMANAHLKDAVAHAEFLWWLEREMEKGSSLTELSVSDKFQALRSAQADFVSLSFPTIAASGPHASSPHYAVSKDTDRPLSTNEIFLVDSGAQFRDGTTDVTRTVAFSPMPEFVREAYTRVLKGHIRLARLNFPSGTSGIQLDAVARVDLWEAGLEFRHGTGHGVGHFLNVHEGNYETLARPSPMGIGQRDPVQSREGMKETMVLTIEPGYYHDGEFGIRIENVYKLVKAETKHRYQGMEYLTFRPLTLVPISTQLILPQLMTPPEVEWVNEYHAECLRQVGPLLQAQGKPQVLSWLQNACKAMG